MANHLLRENLQKRGKKTGVFLLLLAVICAAFIGTALFEYFKLDLVKKFEGYFSSGTSIPKFSGVGSSDSQIIEKAHIARLEMERDAILERVQFFEKLLQDLKTPAAVQSQVVNQTVQTEGTGPLLKTWGEGQSPSGRNIYYEIPAGTVVKCMISSAADCSVAIQNPIGRNTVLLRPMQDGFLPNHIFVPLKDSVIIGTAVGDITSERVYINGERITLALRNGEFIETEIEAFVSGEDRKEGIRGTIVDRSESILNRPGFASLINTISQEQLQSKEGAISKAPMIEVLADYYIKRTEQLQPSIQVQPGRVVNLVFTKAVKIRDAAGEN
ncbi:MAG: TraB/VirB10 family protein [Chlamydiia bacterium]|nr:TraB/VirB10 family protein [Chlamydiia bacterium]